MDQTKITKTWIRWLAGRKVEKIDAEALIREMDAQPEIGETLMQDLDIHRQLAAMQILEQDEFSFVGKAVARFEMAQQDLPECSDAEIEEMLDCEDRNLSNPQSGTRAIEAPPLQVNRRGQTSSISAGASSQRSSRAKPLRRSMLKGLALATCILLMGSIVWFAYEMGRRSGPGATSKQAINDSNKPNLESNTVQPKARAAAPEPASNLASKDALAGNQKPIEKSSHQERATDGLLDPQADSTNLSKENSKRTPPATLVELPRKPTNTFAKVTEEKDAVWGEQPMGWPRLGSQFIDLESGTVTVELDRGGEFTVQGPARFSVNEQGVDIESGRAAFVMPDLGLEEYVVNARNNQIQPAGIARFQLNVNDQASDLELERGAIEVNPWFGRMVTNPMQLEAGKLDRLTIEGHDGKRPAVARLTGGPQTQFEGWVNFQDRVFKSKDAKLVEDVFQRARKRFDESPQNLGVEWKNLTDFASDQLSERLIGMPPGNLNLPNAPNPREMMKQVQEMMEQMQRRARGGAGNPFQGGFRWSFDGSDFQFQTEGQTDSDLKSINQQLLGPFADLADQIKTEQGK